MSFERFHLTLPTDLYEAMEAERRGLGQSRAMFVRRALEAALDGGNVAGAGTGAPVASPSVSPRASANFGAVERRVNRPPPVPEVSPPDLSVRPEARDAMLGKPRRYTKPFNPQLKGKS